MFLKLLIPQEYPELVCCSKQPSLLYFIVKFIILLSHCCFSFISPPQPSFFLSSVSIPPLLRLFLTFSLAYLITSFSFSSSSLFPPSSPDFPSFPASCFLFGHILPAAPDCVGRENQTLSELRQGKPNADRAYSSSSRREERGRGGAGGEGVFREIKRSQSSGLCWEGSPPCWDKLLVINALKIDREYQDMHLKCFK